MDLWVAIARGAVCGCGVLILLGFTALDIRRCGDFLTDLERREQTRSKRRQEAREVREAGEVAEDAEDAPPS